MGEVNHNPFNVDVEDLAKAGLWTAAPYNFTFQSMKAAEKNVWRNGERTDETYSVINCRLVATERAIYDSDGNLESIEEMDPTKSRFHDFTIQGNGLKALNTAYKAVTGQAPQGVLNEETGRYAVDTLAIAEELVGSSAWNKVFHTEINDKGNIYDKITYTFTSNPPQRFGVQRKPAAEVTS